MLIRNNREEREEGFEPKACSTINNVITITLFNKKKKPLLVKLDTIEKLDSTYGIQASSDTPQHAKWCFFFNVKNLCSYKFEVIHLSSEIFVFANYNYK